MEEEELAREELRVRLMEAELALKEAEEAYALYVQQIDHYKRAIRKQKVVILGIKSSLAHHLHGGIN